MNRRSDSDVDTPLFAWGEALCAARRRRRRLVRHAAALALGTFSLAATIVVPPAPRLLWNASASAPIGLYAVSPGGRPTVGDTVIAWPPARVRLLAASRHYLPLNVPLVKHVAAASGDEICALGATIFINGLPQVVRRKVDGRGRALPWWDGCLRLRDDQVFLVMTASADSFDGRYFGVSDRADVIGTARLIWAER